MRSHFKVGDVVEHTGCGEGVVSAIEDGCVCVTYDRTDASGKNWTGRYDGRWFEIHPNLLRKAVD